MDLPQLTVAPEIRKGPVFYHFSYRDNQFDRRGFSRQDSLVFSLNKIFDTDLPGVPADMRSIVINTITNELDVEHKNLLMLCLATLVIHLLRFSNAQLTPLSFTAYYNSLSGVMVKDVKDKKVEEIQILHIKYKATFYRYLIYVQTNSRS